VIARIVLAGFILIGLFAMGVNVGHDIREQEDTFAQVGWCMKRDKLDAHVSR
jgi:hypothetical protein